MLAFAVCSPLAVAIVRRGGADFALTVSMAGAILGTLLRSAGGLPAALLGTAVMGLFLTIGNVVVPLIISREFPPERVHFMTGVYTSAINVGTMTVTLATDRSRRGSVAGSGRRLGGLRGRGARGLDRPPRASRSVPAHPEPDRTSSVRRARA